MTKPRTVSASLLLAPLWVILSCLSCAYLAPTPTPPPDYAALETRVALALGGTLTAKAPPTATYTPEPTLVPPTQTLTPTGTPSPTPSPEPTPAPTALSVAYVRVAQDHAANIVLYNVTQGEETVLTHFAEPLNMDDLTWSKDGEWLVFVSAHDYMHSRNNERNVFAMRPDGTGLRMITGEYLDPATAPAPYVTLAGQVVGGEGACLVCAQGSPSLVTAGEDGSFELPGVPVSATWARAVCQNGEVTLQGSVGLSIKEDELPPVSIKVEPRGQGWSQASVARDGSVIAGTRYYWTLDEEGQREYHTEGVLYGWEDGLLGKLELPPDTSLVGVDWSPVSNEIVGALTGEKETRLLLWDATGALVGTILEIPNPERIILSATNPVWSPDGLWLVFGLRQRDWWADSKYKTELMVVTAAGESLAVLVETDWGIDAVHPCWSADGKRVYYQVAKGAPGDDWGSKTDNSLWAVTLSGNKTLIPWAAEGTSYLPAAHPCLVSRPDFLCP